MKRITRYVLQELIAVFLTTLLGMTLLMVLVGLVRQSVREGMGLGPVLRMVPYALPEALRFSVPATILLATCSVFGRLSADNEIVALKSLGIHPRVVFIPALFLAFTLSIVAVWLNDVAVTWGRDGVYRIAMESLEQIVYGVLRTQKSYSTPRLSISVKAVRDHQLLQPFIAIYPDNGDPPITVSARLAELQGDTQENTLRMRLEDGILERDDVSLEFRQHELVIPLTNVHRKGGPARRASDCALSAIAPQLQAERRHLRAVEREMAYRSALQLASGSFEQLSSATWRESLLEWTSAVDRTNRLRVEPWRRWANGFSCFCFVLVGAPLAVRMRTTNFFTTFAACFLPILFLYYPLMTYSADQAKYGHLPAFAVWLGNGVLTAAGYWHLRRVVRQ